jgi:hypothetical protein
MSYARPMRRIYPLFLTLTALITGLGSGFLWWRLGSSATPPALLALLIAITCVLRLVTLKR